MFGVYLDQGRARLRDLVNAVMAMKLRVSQKKFHHYLLKKDSTAEPSANNGSYDRGSFQV